MLSIALLREDVWPNRQLSSVRTDLEANSLCMALRLGLTRRALSWQGSQRA
jgi:hypothetical protein